MRRALTTLLSPLLLLSLWEIAAWLDWVDVRFFPPPSSIFHYLLFDAFSDGILRDLWASLYRIFWGYTAGTIAGIALGIAMGLTSWIRSAVYPLVAMTYPLPKIAILPLIMLIFGIGELSKIIVVAIGAFFLVLLNTLSGVDNIARIHYDVAKVYSIGRRPFFWRVIFPAALPSIFTGLKLAIGYSLVVVVAAEFSGANAGIGYLIWQSWETFSIKSMYAAIFIIGLLGFGFAYVIELLERLLIPWRSKNRD